jgi:hypothetical protein
MLAAEAPNVLDGALAAPGHGLDVIELDLVAGAADASALHGHWQQPLSRSQTSRRTWAGILAESLAGAAGYVSAPRP